jgi:hypothetical protein
MPGADVRRFTLADVMILVAAAAGGMALSKALHDYAGGLRRDVVLPYTVWWAKELPPFVLAAAIGLLIVRGRSPRPPARRFLREPGTIACLVVLGNSIAALLIYSVRMLLTWHFRHVGALLGPLSVLSSTLYSGHAVAIAWAVLAVTRVWRPDPGWIDRTGRCFGIFLIALWLSMMVGF